MLLWMCWKWELWFDVWFKIVTWYEDEDTNILYSFKCIHKYYTLLFNICQHNWPVTSNLSLPHNNAMLQTTTHLILSLIWLAEFILPKTNSIIPSSSSLVFFSFKHEMLNCKFKFVCMCLYFSICYCVLKLKSVVSTLKN